MLFEGYTYEDFSSSKIPYLAVLEHESDGLTLTQAQEAMQKQAERVGWSARSFRQTLREVQSDQRKKDRRSMLAGLPAMDPEQFLSDDGKTVVDARIVNFLLEGLDIINLDGRLFLYDTGYFRNGEDRLRRIIARLIPDRLRKARVINGVFDLLKIEADHKHIDQMNRMDRGVICFRDCMLDTRTLERFDHDPSYLCLNQIPHAAPAQEEPEAGITAEWLSWAIPDPSDRELLLAFAGLCLCPDRKFQVFLLLEGAGGNGKSVYLNNVAFAVGNPAENISNVPLEKLTASRFSAACLSGKLANICGDIRTRAIPDTNQIKQITGDDTIDAEYKGKDPFSFRPYAKQLFSINGLPVIEDDKTGAFFRRLRVVRFERTPEHVDPELGDKLEDDIAWFIWNSVQALHRSYCTLDGRFTDSPNSRRAVQEMRNESDTVAAWLSDCIEIAPGTQNRTSRGDWYNLYLTYCEKADRTPCRKNEFIKRMKPHERKSGVLCYPDLKWRSDAEFSAISI